MTRKSSSPLKLQKLKGQVSVQLYTLDVFIISGRSPRRIR